MTTARTMANMIIQLEAHKDEISLEIKAAYDAAKSAGISKRGLRMAIRFARMTPQQRADHDEVQRDFMMIWDEISDEVPAFREAAE